MLTTPQTQPAYLTSQDVADLLRLSVRTLERMRVDGNGPRFLKAGTGKRSRVLYRLEDIQSWLESQAYYSTSEFS